MIEFPSTLIEPGIGYWRTAKIDEDGFPVSLSFHDDSKIGCIGSIHPATVTGLDTNSDIAFLSLGKDQDGSMLSGMMNLRRAKQLVKGPVHSIADCLQEGQKLMVQVLSEPASFDNKSLIVTPKPRLDGRYVSVEAGASRLNFSKDLGPKTIKGLKAPLTELTENVAIIVRSRAANIAVEIVIQEAEWLAAAITDKSGFTMPAMAKALISITEGTEPVYIDNKALCVEARKLAHNKWPDIAERIEPYQGSGATSAFEEYGVEEAIEDALADQIPLPSGGWISIHQTPALTSIDVNMGGALQQMSAAEAKLTVNMEAALAIAHHLRFQDIGGLIVVDFIDMSGKGTAAKLLELFDKALKDDPVPVRRSGISMFGLVEMSRQRKGVSLRDRYQVQAAPVMRIREQALKLLRTAQHIGNSNEPGTVILQASVAVCGWFDENKHVITELEANTHRIVELRSGKDDVYIEAKS
ncbi:ribonuclease E/G [Kordiimonas sp. SCSIO 12610]|uniref:ribonuclease E/G n=1 Tax=Kordiimonas sp. SCSIO 12610 TaxID=2829597 RepID=UPI00210AAC2F|nr:ribonuclease E/G [Kordiimonas sp. SCSIO 12610]UTW55691.1 ribonuclease E/G [Kordiimonas sp. SCSIO 12610]